MGDAHTALGFPRARGRGYLAVREYAYHDLVLHRQLRIENSDAQVLDYARRLAVGMVRILWFRRSQLVSVQEIIFDVERMVGSLNRRCLRRFRAMCKDSRPWLVHFISFLLFVQVVAWTGVAVTRCVAQWVPADSVILIPKVRFAMVSAVYELDAIANCIMSLAFIYHLRSLHPSPAPANSFLASWRPKPRSRSPSGASDVAPVVSRPNSRTSSVKSATEETGEVILYASMSQMLMRSQVLLFVECAFTLAVTVIQVVDLTIDPLWFLMSCSQAIRCLVYCAFQRDLTDVLKSRARKPGAAAKVGGKGAARRASPTRGARASMG
ncbi:hypothetical protein, variant [Allomyces macrogynus ATCC 38327]|uniref:Uncharacterized protein n=1 Tax=Allomyces macrogynus (strain ATCC 38327) TaxID=578462 RepID=A0A0L0S6R0_ALLM3|nr:hypothetical protein, variant [Allomyces macrogynus ATCC 38327]|eukprot:KNE58071.1 hypothetical protein, variant [Allomyces macrogynus ATCC 38327]